MPLWGNHDNAANSDIGALSQVNQSPANTTARTLLFNNTTANTVVKSAKGAGNVVVGQFFANAAEMVAAQVSPGGTHPQHAGWVLRHEGRGLKAGRVWYETLVAMGSSKSDASDDTYFPDYAIVISSNASSNSSATVGNLNFTVVSSSVPTGASLTYQWQRNNGGWANVAYAAGQYFNPTTATLTANNITANGNVFRVMVMTAGGNTVFSSNATIAKV
jgi:hypothetical protein